MSSDGELYIQETCRDVFWEQLNEQFGEGNWRLDARGFYDFWDLSQFPSVVEIPVLDNETDKVLGIAKIVSKPEIKDDGYGRYIDVEPECEDMKHAYDTSLKGEGNGSLEPLVNHTQVWSPGQSDP